MASDNTNLARNIDQNANNRPCRKNIRVTPGNLVRSNMQAYLIYNISNISAKTQSYPQRLIVDKNFDHFNSPYLKTLSWLLGTLYDAISTLYDAIY